MIINDVALDELAIRQRDCIATLCGCPRATRASRDNREVLQREFECQDPFSVVAVTTRHMLMC